MNLDAAGLVSVIGWALVDFLWQGVLVALVLAPALALLRDARPQARYAIALAGLLACVLLPLASVLGALVGGAGTAQGASAQFLAAAATGSGSDDGDLWRSAVDAYLPWIVVAWSAGAGILALRFALGCAWVSRQRATATSAPGDWQLQLDRLSSRMGLRRAPRLQVADALDGPVVAGCWRPVVLVPAAMLAAMPVELLEALLAHELAHVRRHDYLVNLVQNAIETLLFYHPVVWWLSRRIRIEREQIADDLALVAIAEPRRLARALQQLDRLQQDARFATSSHLVTAAHGGKLMNRIQRLARPAAASSGKSSLLPLIALAALCLSVYAHATSRNGEPAIVDQEENSIAAAASAATRTGRDTYALVREGEEDMMVSGDSKNLAEVRKIREQLHGDFLWFQRGSGAYVVQDPALLAQARAAWAPAQAQGARMQAIGDEMKPHSERMEQLGKQMEAIIGQSAPDQQRMQEVARRMEPVAERQRELAGQMQVLAERMREQRDDASQQRLASEMDALQARMRPLDEQLSALGDEMSERGRVLEAQHEPLEALGNQMEAAGKPMEALGKRMEVLGKQQEALSHEADARVRQLLDQALREGKARPSPAAAGH